MNGRKRAFEQGLTTIRKPRTQTSASRKSDKIGSIRPSLYNARGMPDTNQIINGDSIKILNDGPEGWVDLVFADPPFNIGYLYHGYNDELKADHYLKFSKDCMAAV